MKSNLQKITEVIFKIRKELLANRARFDEKYAKLPEYLQIIQEKEPIVEDLRHKLQIIQHDTETYMQKFQETKREKNQYEKQAEQIENLANQIHQFNEMSAIDPNELLPIPREKEIEIGFAIEQVFKPIIDSTSFDYEAEHQKLSKLNGLLDREISILKLVKAKTIPFDDSFDIYLDDNFSLEEPNSKSQNKHFSFKNSIVNSINQNPIQFTNHYKEKTNLINEQIENQYESLKQITDLLHEYPLQSDTLKIYNLLQNRLQQMREIRPITAIQIPNQNSIQKSSEELFSKIESFKKILLDMHEQKVFSQTPSVDMPNIENHVFPCYTKNFQLDSSITHLINDSKSIIDSLNTVDQNNSIQSHQQIEQLSSMLPNPHIYSMDTSSLTPGDISENEEPFNEDDYTIDTSAIDRFREMALEKLPDNFMDGFVSNRISIDIPEITEEQKTEIQDDFEVSVDNSQLEKRLLIENNILRSLLEMPNEEIPELTMPHQQKEDEQFDEPDFDSFLSSYQKLLSPQQQTIDYLKDEILQIQKDIDEVNAQLNQKGIDDDLDDYRTEKENLESENQKLLKRIQQNELFCNNLNQEIQRQCEQMERIQQENQQMQERINSFQITEDVMNQKEKEYEEAKEEFENAKKGYEETKRLYEQLMEEE